jgi:hypothetical protein
MSFVVTQQESLAAAARDLHRVGSAMTSHTAATATPTSTVVPPATDVVSVLTAAQFAMHAHMYQAASSDAVTEAADTIAAG